MSDANRFNYEGLFAKNAPVGAKTTFRRPKYDFAVAYPDPDTLPLEWCSRRGPGKPSP